jgi:hypothetical protein
MEKRKGSSTPPPSSAERLRHTDAHKEARLLGMVDSHEITDGDQDHLSLRSFLRLSKETKEILTTDKRGISSAKKHLQARHHKEGGGDSLKKVLAGPSAAAFGTVNMDGNDWGHRDGEHGDVTSPKGS